MEKIDATKFEKSGVNLYRNLEKDGEMFRVVIFTDEHRVKYSYKE